MHHARPLRPASHPALLIAAARDSVPPLTEPGYSTWLLTLTDAADRLGGDDVTTTDRLVRDIIIALQDAAVARLDGER